MHEAKQSGAIGLFFSGIAGSLTLNHPHFNPIEAFVAASAVISQRALEARILQGSLPRLSTFYRL